VNHKVSDDIRNCVLRKYNNTCQRCGRRFNDTSKLHVHHKSYDSEKEKRLENYVLLCGRCHMDLHGLSPTPMKPKPLFDSRKFIVGEKIKKAKEKGQGD